MFMGGWCGCSNTTCRGIGKITGWCCCHDWRPKICDSDLNGCKAMLSLCHFVLVPVATIQLLMANGNHEALRSLTGRAWRAAVVDRWNQASCDGRLGTATDAARERNLLRNLATIHPIQTTSACLRVAQKGYSKPASLHVPMCRNCKQERGRLSASKSDLRSSLL